MRLIDADKIVFDYSGLAHISRNDLIGIAKYFADQIEAMPTIAPPPNEPLTLEELREMDGEPVWVVQVSGKLRPFWMLVDAEDESAASRLYCAMFEDYGAEWLAYRRKLEEAE